MSKQGVAGVCVDEATNHGWPTDPGMSPKDFENDQISRHFWRRPWSAFPVSCVTSHHSSWRQFSLERIFPGWNDPAAGAGQELWELGQLAFYHREPLSRSCAWPTNAILRTLITRLSLHPLFILPRFLAAVLSMFSCPLCSGGPTLLLKSIFTCFPNWVWIVIQLFGPQQLQRE